MSSALMPANSSVPSSPKISASLTCCAMVPLLLPLVCAPPLRPGNRSETPPANTRWQKNGEKPQLARPRSSDRPRVLKLRLGWQLGFGGRRRKPRGSRPRFSVHPHFSLLREGTQNQEGLFHHNYVHKYVSYTKNWI
jgi:hypothetical protein